MISYRTGNDLDLDVVIELYRASTLGERRPVDDRACMEAMLRNANLVVSAWDGDLLVGVARSVSDFSYCTYSRTWRCGFHTSDPASGGN